MNAKDAFLTISQDDVTLPTSSKEWNIATGNIARAAVQEAKQYVSAARTIIARLNVVDRYNQPLLAEIIVEFIIAHKNGHPEMLDNLNHRSRLYDADAFWASCVEIAQALGYLPSDEPEAVEPEAGVSVESIVALDGDFVAIADATLTAIAPMPFDAAMEFALNVLDALIQRGVQTNVRTFSNAEVEFWFLNYLVGHSGADNRFTQSVFDRQKEAIVRWKDRAFRLFPKQVRALVKCAVEYWQSGNHPAIAAYAAAEAPTLKGVDPVVDRAAETAMTAAKQGPMRGKLIITGKVSNAMDELTKRGYKPRYITERRGTRTWSAVVVDVDGWTQSAVDELEEVVTGQPIGWGEYTKGIDGCSRDGGYWNSEDEQDEAF